MMGTDREVHWLVKNGLCVSQVPENQKVLMTWHNGMREWFLSMCEESARRVSGRKETRGRRQKREAEKSCRQTGGRKSSGSQGSVLKQTVTLAPITALSSWIFSPPPEWFPVCSCLGIQYRQAQMGTQTLSPKDPLQVSDFQYLIMMIWS